MFAYVIIAIELLILYTVFWYVFLREPKPYRIQGNAWGAYDGLDPALKSFTQGRLNMAAGGQQGHVDNCNCHGQRRNGAIYEEWNTTSSSAQNVPLTAGELIRSQSRGVERAIKEMPVDARRVQQNNKNQRDVPQNPSPLAFSSSYAAHNPVEQYRSKYQTLPAFLAQLGDKLNRINVKLP